MGGDLGTAQAVRDALQAALAEAIRPYCEAPAGRRRGNAPRPPPPGPARPESGGALHLAERQWRRIGRDVLALHEGYTQRSAPFAHEANPIHARLAAYQLYFLPRNWYRVHRVLESLPWAPEAGTGLPASWLAPGERGTTLHVLDLGCGTGAFSLAWLAWLAMRPVQALQGVHVHLTLVDQGHELLNLAVANLEAFARRVLPGVTLHCEAHAEGVQAFLGAAPPRAHYAVAGAAMTLNELALLGPRRVSRRAGALAESLRRLVRPGGCLVFVEPGTRRGYLNLMALREPLRALPVLYPCPHNAPCPMWNGPVRSWCHATERLPAGFFFDAALRRHAGVTFQMRDLQLAALAVQVPPGAGLAPPFRSRPGERIVSAPMKARRKGAPAGGGRVVLACAPDGCLHDRPAPAGGPYTRGSWRDPPHGGAP